MKTQKRFGLFGFALTVVMVLGAVLYNPGATGQIASAAPKAVNCITVGIGLTPAGKQCGDFTLDVKFTQPGGNNGTSNNVARGNHNHLGQTWNGSVPVGLTLVNNGGNGLKSSSTVANGVIGASSSTGDSGVYGENLSGGGFGTAGRAKGTGIAVWGDNLGSGPGVRGNSVGGPGVAGYTSELNTAGVTGWNTNNCASNCGWLGIGVEGHGWIGVSGKGKRFGVVGESSDGDGVYGLANKAGSGGVVGTNTQGNGVIGSSINGVGVYGYTQAGNGLEGHSSSAVSSGVYGENKSGGYGVAGRANGSGTAVLGDNTSTTGWAGYFNGRVRVGTLKVGSGADLAERFEDAHETPSEPGMVMVIDAEHPGKLRMSTSAYDNKVAGIVSGAGEIRTGMILQQDGVMEGNISVAMVGRVYCQAEATSNPIRPGDLLTTSALPGHCMKAADATRANGAIIGKAMTGLDAGKGLVLVLVNLQ